MYLKIDNMKTPYIKYDPKSWTYIKNNLEHLGYRIVSISSWESFPYIVLDFQGYIGDCSNLSSKEASSRYEMTDIEEFIERAAILIGRQCKRKDMVKIHGIEIKPGMVITTNNIAHWVVFPFEEGLGVVCYGDKIWGSIGNFILDYEKDITFIRDKVSPINNSLTSGKVLWEKPKKIVITKKEVADKFGVSIENLTITV